MIYRNCKIIRQWTGNSQPDTYVWEHDNYDGPPSPLCGYGKTLKIVMSDIDDVLEDIADENIKYKLWVEGFDFGTFDSYIDARNAGQSQGVFYTVEEMEEA